MKPAIKLRQLCEARNWTQSMLRAKLHELGHPAAGSTINAWFNKQQTPSVEYLLPISRLLGVTVDYLLDETQTEPSPSSRALTREEERLLYCAHVLGLDTALARIYGYLDEMPNPPGWPTLLHPGPPAPEPPAPDPDPESGPPLGGRTGKGKPRGPTR